MPIAPFRHLLFVLTLTLALLPTSRARAESVDPASLEDIGSLRSFTKDAQGLTLRCVDGSEVRLSVLAPDLVRVRASFRRPLAAMDHSWAIERTKWPAVTWTLAQDPKELVVSTSELRVVVTRSPLLIRFVDPFTNQVINQDAMPMRHEAAGSRVAAVKRLGFDEHFYGLGEKAAHLDRRRGSFDLWSADTPGYTEGTDPLYQSIPFYIGLVMERTAQAGARQAWHGRAYGIFFDNSHRTHFDFGSSQNEHTVFAADGGEMNYYFFWGPSMKKVVSRYADLTGHIPIPPKWALGHQQSRWSYYPDRTAEAIVQRYRDEDMPLDALHLDIHYMDGYRVFTWDSLRFPDPAGFVRKMRSLGAHVVTIVDPGVKYEPGGKYGIYNEGATRDFFLKRRSGKTWVGRVWPGESVFVDYTIEAARHWWGEKHRALFDVGVEGIWNDMNEPANFDDPTGKTLMDVVSDDMGRRTTHAANRNLFALNMARATYEGFRRLRPDLRPYIITRSGYAGIQRYATMWTGDNVSSWDAMALSIPMLCSVGLSGEAFAGCDIGGFQGRSTAEMVTRWYQVAFLSPFCRNHKSISGNDQEPWRFGEPYADIIRRYLKLRYALMPYLYTTVAESHRTGVPALRPLILDDQDDYNALGIDDEYLMGSDLLVAPVLAAGQNQRQVYLPRGTWYDYWHGTRLEGGRMISVAAPLDTAPLYVRGGAIVPFGPSMNFVGEKPTGDLTLRIYPDARGTATGLVYDDDGTTPSYQQGNFRRLSVEARGEGQTWRVHVHAATGPYSVGKRRLVFHLRLPGGQELGAAVPDDGMEHDVVLGNASRTASRARR